MEVETVQMQTILSDYGFPVMAAAAIVWFLWWIWNYVVTEIYPRIRRLHVTANLIMENQRKYQLDIVRLSEKLETVLEINGAETSSPFPDEPQ